MSFPTRNANGADKQNISISIIGGGLVGSLAAIHLARKGHNINLYEYREDIRKAELVAGRSINLSLSARGRKALADIGLETALLQHGIPMRGRMLHDLQGNKTMVPYDNYQKQCIYSVGRKHLNEVLLNATDLYANITLNFNQKLISTNIDEGTFCVKNVKTKEINEISSDLLIGCDGAFSTVRRNMLGRPGFDFTQTYIEHGYIELCIPAKDGEFAMPENFLHIWPRGKFMMIALPNQDKSWTVTLFMPFLNFKKITTVEKLLNFFNTQFPDSIKLIGKEKLTRDFFNAKPQSLVSIKCRYYHVSSKVLIIGDAAHAMVPFYGQGMNAGFEDCTILSDVLRRHPDNIGNALEEFSEIRWENAHSICDLAMYNYTEMRDLVNRKSYRLRKTFDDFLYYLLPNFWIPLYISVSFSHIPYKECVANRKWQDKVITTTLFTIGITLLGFACSIIFTFLKFDSLQDLVLKYVGF